MSKLWLDDVRQPPSKDWVWFDSADGIIGALRNIKGQIELISLDHDLGDRPIYGNGYEVMLWIEKEVHTNPQYVCPRIAFHTANPEGRRMMGLVIVSIERKLKRRVFSE